MQLQVTFLFSEAELKRFKKRADTALSRDGVFEAAYEFLTKLSGGVVHKREDFENFMKAARKRAPGARGRKKPPTEAPDATGTPQAGRSRR